MAARYLIRFDDICPTMDWDKWQQIEAILIAADVRPLLAVVPDNRDPALAVAAARPDFWERVRGWQARGWAIGLHGFQHRYVTGESGIVGVNARSEFAGLPIEQQRDKIQRGLALFREQGVTADAWVAPGHSFDENTVSVLRESGIHVISDGYFAAPVRIHGMSWVPQQLWRFRDLMAGTWTVCYHHNSMSSAQCAALAHDVRRFANRLTSLRGALEHVRAVRPADFLLARAWLAAIRAKRALAGRRRRKEP
jgi:predicted deacetylase